MNTSDKNLDSYRMYYTGGLILFALGFLGIFFLAIVKAFIDPSVVMFWWPLVGCILIGLTICPYLLHRLLHAGETDWLKRISVNIFLQSMLGLIFCVDALTEKVYLPAGIAFVLTIWNAVYLRYRK